PKPTPPPTPKPTPPPTPRPTPPPTPSPEPTPNPTPPPMSTPPPTVPGGAATRAPVAQAAGASDIGTLPFAGEALPEGSAQAIAIDPTPQQATAADQVRERDRQGSDFGGAANVDQRNQQVIPHPEKLEDDQRRDRRHRKGQDQTEEDRHRPGAVDLRRFEKVLGQDPEEVGQQIN